MKIKLYLDTRAVGKGKKAPLKISIAHKGKSALLSLGIYLAENQFNAGKERIENHENKLFLNSFIKRRLIETEEIILKLRAERKLAGMTVTEIKNYVQQCLDGESQQSPSFASVLTEFTNNIENYHTRRTYQLTSNKLTIFDAHFQERRFENLNFIYLENFEKFLSENGMSQNSRAVMFKNISAVFTYARKQKLTECNPFVEFKYKMGETAKRALTIEQVRLLFNHTTKGKKNVYQDILKLSFFLIGINIVDLGELREIDNGRVEYDRAKTGRHYSIKVEPEAQEIIARLRDSERLVPEIGGYSKYDSFMVRYNTGIKALTAEAFSGTEYEKLASKISHYWIRHTWATIAASLDIPRDTIAHALGHGKSTVTDIYIDFDLKKVDEANRKVIDYVLYNKMC